ncbi:MAG: hypothetical protein PF637_08505, partial [Spirochaetes bacterium]|nr:hypothetical protein [Spirochaetota bacterium]
LVDCSSLKSKYFRLIHKGKNSNVAKTAVARELVSFIFRSHDCLSPGRAKRSILIGLINMR